MIIDRRVHKFINDGVYSEVFEVDGKAYKVSKSGFDFSPRQSNEGRKRIFQSQCEAYQLLSSDPWLKSHVPTFYGTCNIEDVIDEHGTSIKEDFLLDCCYVIEVLDLGEKDRHTLLYKNEAKLTTDGVRENNPQVREAVSRFSALGITTMDSSVIDYSDPEKFKFIDFEINNY